MSTGPPAHSGLEQADCAELRTPAYTDLNRFAAATVMLWSICQQEAVYNPHNQLAECSIG